MQYPDVGLEEVLNIVLGLSAAGTPNVAVGTGADAEAVSDTDLATLLVSVLASTATVSGNVMTVKAFLTTAQGNDTLSEAGMFSPGGVLLTRGLLTPTKAKSVAQEAVVEIASVLERG